MTSPTRNVLGEVVRKTSTSTVTATASIPTSVGFYCNPPNARTIARMPARIASGSRSHASMTAARSASSGSRLGSILGSSWETFLVAISRFLT